MCKAYQPGNRETQWVDGSPKCKHNAAEAHQCNLCLGWHTPNSQDCKGATAAHTLVGRIANGTAKGKGRGKGREGGRGRW